MLLFEVEVVFHWFNTVRSSNDINFSLVRTISLLVAIKLSNTLVLNSKFNKLVPERHLRLWEDANQIKGEQLLTGNGFIYLLQV